MAKTSGVMQRQADEFTARIISGNGASFTEEELRDKIDMWTGSQLDYEPLNILTDMVSQRLKAASYAAYQG
jgi:hypothetical protein